MKLITLLLMSIILIFSCENEKKLSKREINSMLATDDPDSISIACDFIRKTKDTSYVSLILKNPYKWKISHRLPLYGLNGYIIMMKTIEELTLIKPFKSIGYKPDTSVIDFYRKEWAKISKNRKPAGLNL